MIASHARTARRPATATRPIGRLLRRALADPHVLLASGVSPAAAGAAALTESPATALIAVLGLILVIVQIALARPTPRVLARASTRHTVRLIATLAFVGAANSQLGQTAAWPAVSLFLPVVALGAALGRFEALWVSVAAATALVLPAMAMGADHPIGLGRGLVLAAAAGLLILGTRRTVAALEESLERARRLIAANRRRTAQLTAIDDVGGLLASSGPTPEALARIMALFSRQLSYPWVSIYLGSDAHVVIGAQVGYSEPRREFDGTRGIIGRTMRSHAVQYVPNVADDPDYLSVDGAVRSEICVPLMTGEEMLGLVNVEAPGRLEADDVATVRLVADRIASALALAREREALARRADLSRRLLEYAADVAGTLEAPAVHEAIAKGAAQVLEAALVGVAVRGHGDGRYVLAALTGADHAYVGQEVKPGEGMAGRAIRERAIVVDDHFDVSRSPVAVESADALPDVLAAAAVPLVRDDLVVGAITVLRSADRPFDVLEQEMLQVLAGPAALAISNAELLAQVTESSLRDPLTGLFNRRYLDASLERMQALRARQRPEDQHRVTAILFDLDHFGELNKQHGHQVGDTVLRGFADVLRGRSRASDLVARYGGEEFLVLLEGASIEDTRALAETIRRRFADMRFEGAGEPVRVTVSAGCGTTGDGIETMAELVRIADAGLAMAKRGGRDQVVAA